MSSEIGVRRFRRLVSDLHQLSVRQSLTKEDLDGIRTDWQKLLNIDDQSFDDRDYEEFPLILHWLSEDNEYHSLAGPGDPIYVFAPTMGNPQLTVEYLRALDAVDDRETPDLDQKVSLGNKVRRIMDVHSEIVNSVTAYPRLVERVSLLYKNDVYYRDRPDESFPDINTSGPLSSDDEFDRQYNLGLVKLLPAITDVNTVSESDNLINETAVDSINRYMSLKGLSIFYNAGDIQAFEAALWGIVKFCYVGTAYEEDVSSIVDQYSQLNPIMSILKPLYRYLDTQIQPSVIPVTQLISIVEQLIDCSPDAPITLLHFPKLLEFYASIFKDGETPLESDPYFDLINRTISSWIDEDITYDGLFNELVSLSGVPAMVDEQPRTISGVVYPTPQLRQAQILLMKSLAKERKYFDDWLSEYRELDLVSRRVPDLRRLEERPYFKTWQRKLANLRDLDIVSERHVAQRYFLKWKASYTVKKVTDTTNVQKLNLWKKQFVIDTWNSRLQQYTELNVLAAKQYNTQLKARVFFKWEGRSTKAILKQRKLCNLERKFVLEQHLLKWFQAYRYRELEHTTAHANGLYLKRFVFDRIVRASYMNKVANKLLETRAKRRLHMYFQWWVRSYVWKIDAQETYATYLLKTNLKKWVLETLSTEFEDVKRGQLLRLQFKEWNLNTKLALLREYRGGEEEQKWFNHWVARVESVTSQEAKAEHKYSDQLVKQKFGHWKNRYDQVASLPAKCVQFRRAHERRYAVIYLSRWKTRLDSIKEKNCELAERSRQQLLDGPIRSCFNSWYIRYDKYRHEKQRADSIWANSLLERCMIHWFQRYDKIVYMTELCQNELDLRDGKLVSKMMSKMSLTLMRYEADGLKADSFKQRAQRNMTRTFFDLWQIKYDQRKEKDNPYLETVESSTPIREVSFADTATLVSPPFSPFHTPMRHSSLSSVTSSARRMRQANLEQRANHYRQVRDSPDNSVSFTEVPTPTRSTSSRRVHSDVL